jgi:hypothetical protein
MSQCIVKSAGDIFLTIDKGHLNKTSSWIMSDLHEQILVSDLNWIAAFYVINILMYLEY